MANLEEVTKILGILAAFYPNQKIPAETFKAYYMVLKDLPADVLGNACLQCAAETRFFPFVAEIRAMAQKLIGISNRLPTANEAWGEVYGQILRWGHGRYEMTTFSNECIRTALGGKSGWDYICQVDDSQLKFEKMNFIKAYEECLQRYQDDCNLLPDVKNSVMQVKVPEMVKALAAGMNK